MAAPNILNLSTATGKQALQNVSTTITNIVANANSSNKLIKINSIMISNKQGTPSDVNMEVQRGTIAYPIAANVTIPEKSSLYLLDKDSFIYLEEGDTLRVGSSVSNTLTAFITYEDLT